MHGNPLRSAGRGVPPRGGQTAACARPTTRSALDMGGETPALPGPLIDQKAGEAGTLKKLHVPFHPQNAVSV